MDHYWDCCLCRVEDKGKALRCRTCSGRLKGRERLAWEIAYARKYRRRARLLSSLAAGLGQVYLRRWSTGIVFGLLIPLAIGLVFSVWHGFSYGHLFLAAAALFVLAVAAVDGYLGPTPKRAPCSHTCPAGVAVPDYLQLLLEGDYLQGHALVRTRLPLVGVIGRVCPHPCERRCLRGIDGEPVAINGCKRFLADRYRESVRGEGERRAFPAGANGGAGADVSVGVVGAGPAGLACAYYLRILGVAVTVYEEDSVLGGRLGTTIPDHRLPSDVLDEELDDLKRCGIEFRIGTPVGPGGVPVDELLREHGAIFLGVGARRTLALEVEGKESCLDFQQVLRGARLGEPVPVGRRVAVVGGGNAAMDVCRTALRFGAEEVHLFYRRSRDEMPARVDEVEEAVREGVRFHFLTDPVEVKSEGGRVRSLVLRKMQLGPPDETGRPCPEPVPHSEWVLDVDAVIPALGQQVGGGVFDDPALSGLRREADGRVWCDPDTQQTSVVGVYGGGDAVTGPATAVHAMAQGRRAALGIGARLVPALLRKGPRLADRCVRRRFPGHCETPEEKIREEMPTRSVRSRLGRRCEVEEGFREGAAVREAGRCLQCHREL